MALRGDAAIGSMDVASGFATSCSKAAAIQLTAELRVILAIEATRSVPRKLGEYGLKHRLRRDIEGLGGNFQETATTQTLLEAIANLASSWEGWDSREMTKAGKEKLKYS